MRRIRTTLTIAAAGAALALPVGCDDNEVDKAAKDVEREAKHAVDEAKQAERDLQKNKDLP